MKRLSLRQKMHIEWGLFLLGFLLMLLFSAAEAFFLAFVSLVLMIAGGVLSMVWNRCPHCSAWLGRDVGNFCKNCGEEIDYDEKSAK